MARCVSLLVLLHGVLTFQTVKHGETLLTRIPLSLSPLTGQALFPASSQRSDWPHQKGVLSLSDESSDSSPRHRKSYYIFQLLPIHRLKGKSENAFVRKAADLLAMRTSSVFGAPDIIRPTVDTVASFQLPPARVIPTPSPSTLTPPPAWRSASLQGPVPTRPTQSRPLESRGATSVPGNLGTDCDMSAGFSPEAQVLTTPGFPTRRPLQSTIFPTSPTTKEPRGDV